MWQALELIPSSIVWVFVSPAPRNSSCQGDGIGRCGFWEVIRCWDQTSLQPKLAKPFKNTFYIELLGFMGQTEVWQFFPSVLKCFDVAVRMAGGSYAPDLKITLCLSVWLRVGNNALRLWSPSATNWCYLERTLPSRKIKAIPWNWSLEYSSYLIMNMFAN